MKSIIGFTGLAGSGKSLAATILCQHKNYFPVPFAKPIHNIVFDLIKDEPIPYSLRLDWEYIKGHKFASLGNKSGREIAQTLGTEWGRNLVDPDIWVNLWKERIKPFSRVTVPDVRFINEAQTIRDMGGKLVRITRPGVIPMNHISEMEFNEITPDFTICNDASFGEFRTLVLELI